MVGQKYHHVRTGSSLQIIHRLERPRINCDFNAKPYRFVYAASKQEDSADFTKVLIIKIFIVKTNVNISITCLNIDSEAECGNERD